MASCFRVAKMTFASNFLLMAKNFDGKKNRNPKLISAFKRNVR